MPGADPARPRASPVAKDPAALSRMRKQPRRDTEPELRLRKLLHGRGLRYRVDAPLPLPGVRRRADLLFVGARVAVFVDGCYWHSCPEHRSTPKNNSEWWSRKLATNVDRDRDTDLRLADAGWRVVRVWEHEEAEAAAARIEQVVRG